MKAEYITSSRDIKDPALPEELPSWTTDGNGTVEVKFKLPFPAHLQRANGTEASPVMRDAELVVHIPVGKFAIFTPECALSTKDMIGTKNAKRLLDALAGEYYRGLVISQITQKD